MLHPVAYVFFACATSKLMTSQVPGQGRAWPALFANKDGATLDVGRTSRMHLPPEIPARLCWPVRPYLNVPTRPVSPARSDLPDFEHASQLICSNA